MKEILNTCLIEFSTLFNMILMVFMYAFLANEVPVICAVSLWLNILKIFAINLERVFFSNQVLNLLVDNDH